MDLCHCLSGYWPGAPRKDQLRDEFLSDNEKPFVVGRDFVARSHTSPSIRIHSPRVLDVIRSLIRYNPSVLAELRAREVFFAYPYRTLMYYYKDMQNIRNRCPQVGDNGTLPPPYNDTALDHTTGYDLDVLLTYLKPHYDREILTELDRHDKGFARFSSLWLLFKPDSTCFARVKGQMMIFKVLDITRRESSSGESSEPWSIRVWGLFFDGYLLKRQARCFQIDEFYGDREIKKLPIKPLEDKYLDHRKGQEILRNRLQSTHLSSI
jgi:hypothetical protein